MRTLTIFALLASAATFAVPAAAAPGNLCTVAPGGKWLTRPEVKKIIADAGYQNIKIGFELGCFEGEATKGGKDYEVFVHPVSGKIVKVRLDEDADRDHTGHNH